MACVTVALRHWVCFFVIPLSPPSPWFLFFFFNDTAPPEISTLSLHDPLPISLVRRLLEATRHPLPRGEREPWPERHRTRHAPPCGKPRTPLRSGSPRRAARDPGRRSGIASPRRPPCRPAVRRR